MAFVLKKNKAFEFQIEGSEKVYEIPAIDTFNADEIEAFRKLMGSSDLKNNIETFKEVLFSKCEGLDAEGLSDYQYLMILRAYEESQKADGLSMGES